MEKIIVVSYDFVIINRSFWPIYPVIGEGLMRLAESLVPIKKVAVITQDHSNIKKSLKKFKRGIGVKFFPAWAISSSSSNVVKRIFDAIFFMVWVLIILIRTRPKKIYVSTDPPLIIPFIVAVYSKIMRVEYFYHLQDIHPEATNVVFKINPFLLSFLKMIDNFTIRNASLIITLNDQMKFEIINRQKVKTKISIIENPSVQFNNIPILEKEKGFTFTGNLGRLQRVPLLIQAIKKYSQKGGILKFAFAGGGIYAKQISKLSSEISLVKYYGLVSSEKAASILNNYEWALAPIDDQITRYAFPSKISSYAYAGAKILAICGDNTSVARWIKLNKVGFVINPTVDTLIDTFFKIENNNFDTNFIDTNRKELKKNLSMSTFVNSIKTKIFP